MNDPFPLYDVPWLVRDPNDFYMSAKRHWIEMRNQAVVDDYFIARANGASAPEARHLVAEKHDIKTRKVLDILRWFYQEAVRRGKITFLQKFPPIKEHIVQY